MTSFDRSYGVGHNGRAGSDQPVDGANERRRIIGVLIASWLGLRPAGGMFFSDESPPVSVSLAMSTICTGLKQSKQRRNLPMSQVINVR